MGILRIFNKRNILAVWQLSSGVMVMVLCETKPCVLVFVTLKTSPSFYLPRKPNFYQTHYFRNFFLPTLRYAHCIWQWAPKNLKSTKQNCESQSDNWSEGDERQDRPGASHLLTHHTRPVLCKKTSHPLYISFVSKLRIRWTAITLVRFPNSQEVRGTWLLLAALSTWSIPTLVSQSGSDNKKFLSI